MAVQKAHYAEVDDFELAEEQESLPSFDPTVAAQPKLVPAVTTKASTRKKQREVQPEDIDWSMAPYREAYEKHLESTCAACLGAGAAGQHTAPAC